MIAPENSCLRRLQPATAGFARHEPAATMYNRSMSRVGYNGSADLYLSFFISGREELEGTLLITVLTFLCVCLRCLHEFQMYGKIYRGEYRICLNNFLKF